MWDDPQPHPHRQKQGEGRGRVHSQLFGVAIVAWIVIVVVVVVAAHIVGPLANHNHHPTTPSSQSWWIQSLLAVPLFPTFAPVRHSESESLRGDACVSRTEAADLHDVVPHVPYIANITHITLIGCFALVVRNPEYRDVVLAERVAVIAVVAIVHVPLCRVHRVGSISYIIFIFVVFVTIVFIGLVISIVIVISFVAIIPLIANTIAITARPRCVPRARTRPQQLRIPARNAKRSQERSENR